MSVKSIKARSGHMLAPICVKSLHRTQNDTDQIIVVMLGKGQGKITLTFPKPNKYKNDDLNDYYKDWVGVNWSADPAAPNAGDMMMGNNWEYECDDWSDDCWKVGTTPLSINNIGQAIEYAWESVSGPIRSDIKKLQKEASDRRERIAKSQEGLKGGLNQSGPLIPA